MFAKYAVNLSQAEVQMIDNQIKIPVGGWEGITKTELDHVDVIYAVRQKWIKLQDKEPTTDKSPPKQAVTTINADDPSFSGEKEPRAKVTKLGTR
jgi:hypothetical protein